jgi:glutamyl/glutaminyl-tRNA synthetase
MKGLEIRGKEHVLSAPIQSWSQRFLFTLRVRQPFVPSAWLEDGSKNSKRQDSKLTADHFKLC